MNLQQLASQMLSSFAQALGWRAANQLPKPLMWVALAGAIAITFFLK